MTPPRTLELRPEEVPILIEGTRRGFWSAAVMMDWIARRTPDPAQRWDTLRAILEATVEKTDAEILAMWAEDQDS